MKVYNICLVALFLVTFAFAADQESAASKRRSRQYDEEDNVETVRKICLQKRFYQHQYSLGCQPEFEPSDRKKVCPIRFACQEFEAPGSINKCHVDGKSYNPGDRVPNENKCRECYCGQPDKKRGIPARVECAGSECENVQQLTQTKDEECFYTFSKSDSCCPKKHCVPRGTNGTCEYDDLLFHNGQKIFPNEDPCKVCLCNRRWRGVDSASCTEIQCDMKLERERLLEGCVPVYFQGACCPVDWVCPKGDGAFPKDMHADKCYFDGKEYDVGASLDHGHPSPCVQCRCIAPNLFTCIQESCQPPPRPKPGYQCVPQGGDKVCCPNFDCSVKIKDPCQDNDCRRDEKCVRFLENCRKPPCKDTAECVSRDFQPCDDYQCRKNQICITHISPCPARHCPVRAACLPLDPCGDSRLQCDEGKICRNVVRPCKLAPCPKVAECVNIDPCVDFRCRLNHHCIAVTVPGCQKEPCPKDPICQSPDCSRANCSREEIYRPFGKGKGNCPWCEPKPRRRPSRRRPARRE